MPESRREQRINNDLTKRLRRYNAGENRVQSEQEYRRLVGERLRLQRLARHLTQTQLGDKISESHIFVSRVERGVARLDAWRALLLADALDVPLRWLLDPQAGPVTLTSTPAQAGDHT